jgi:magnesium-transporting ATPase (P-type)
MTTITEPPKAPESKPGSKPDAKDDLKTLPIAEVEKRLDSSPNGLTDAEAKKRLTQYGPNEITEKKTNLFLKFLSYFWGPTRGDRYMHLADLRSYLDADQKLLDLYSDQEAYSNGAPVNEFCRGRNHALFFRPASNLGASQSSTRSIKPGTNIQLM